MVLLNLAMPQMGGLEALPHLRRLVPDAHVLVLSGFASGSAAQIALDANAHGYLQKGLAPNDLIEAINRSLEPSPA